MLEEKGLVATIEPDALWVETIQKSTCGSCVAQKGCGQSLLSKIGVKPTYIRVLLGANQQKDFHLGQEVTIGIPNDIVVKSSLFIYLLPILLMMVFSGVTHTFITNELFSITAGVAGFLFGAVAIKLHAELSKNNTRLQPSLIRSARNNEGIIIQQATH